MQCFTRCCIICFEAVAAKATRKVLGSSNSGGASSSSLTSPSSSTSCLVYAMLLRYLQKVKKSLLKSSVLQLNVSFHALLNFSALDLLTVFWHYINLID